MFIWSYETNALIEKQTINLRNRFESISTKTRIETSSNVQSPHFYQIREQDPLKQGLKLSFDNLPLTQKTDMIFFE